MLLHLPNMNGGCGRMTRAVYLHASSVGFAFLVAVIKQSKAISIAGLGGLWGCKISRIPLF
jgi:hypothetical protein